MLEKSSFAITGYGPDREPRLITFRAKRRRVDSLDLTGLSARSRRRCRNPAFIHTDPACIAIGKTPRRKVASQVRQDASPAQILGRPPRELLQILKRIRL